MRTCFDLNVSSSASVCYDPNPDILFSSSSKISFSCNCLTHLSWTERFFARHVSLLLVIWNYPCCHYCWHHPFNCFIHSSIKQETMLATCSPKIRSKYIARRWIHFLVAHKLISLKCYTISLSHMIWFSFCVNTVWKKGRLPTPHSQLLVFCQCP